MVKQLDGLGLAYLHMIEPRISGCDETRIEHNSYGLGQYRDVFRGAFMAAGKQQKHTEMCNVGNVDFVVCLWGAPELY